VGCSPAAEEARPAKSGAAKKPAAVPPIVSLEENQPFDPSPRNLSATLMRTCPLLRRRGCSGYARNPVAIATSSGALGDPGIY